MAAPVAAPAVAFAGKLAAKALPMLGKLAKRMGINAVVNSKKAKKTFKGIAIAVGGLVLLPLVVPLLFVLQAVEIAGVLAHKPTLRLGVEAVRAAEVCPIAPVAGDTPFGNGLGAAYLLGAAYALTSDDLNLWGGYRNPWGSPAYIPSDIRASVDPAELKAGGAVSHELGLVGDHSLQDWTTVLGATRVAGLWVPTAFLRPWDPFGGEHGIGFLLIRPSDWRAWVQDVPAGALPNDLPRDKLDPYQPYYAFVVLACHLRHVETDVLHLGLNGIEQALLQVGNETMQLVDTVFDIPGHLVGDVADVVNAVKLGFSGMGQAFLDKVKTVMNEGVQLLGGYPPSAFALKDIPPDYLMLIQKWAQVYGIDWTLLAGVLKVECDFGRNCGVSPTGAQGPAQFEPATWATYGVDGNGDGSKDPNDPADAVAGSANYLKTLGLGNPDMVRSALCRYNAGGGPALQACMDGTQKPDYADAVMGWATQYRGSLVGSLPWPIPPLMPQVGWLQVLPWVPGPEVLPHMNPATVTNQCVAGAFATWALMHINDPRWQHPPPLYGDAIALYGAAMARGFHVSSQPVAGSMVVYGAALGSAGHIATVISVAGNRFLLIEQNYVNFHAFIAFSWATFDLRVESWPNPAIEGFIVSPP